MIVSKKESQFVKIQRSKTMKNHIQEECYTQIGFAEKAMMVNPAKEVVSQLRKSKLVSKRETCLMEKSEPLFPGRMRVDSSELVGETK